MKKPCMFIFGFGYTARYLAEKLLALNFQVIGTSRCKDQLQHNSSYHIIDFSLDAVVEYLPLATHVLMCIPPSAHGVDPVINQFSSIITSLQPQLKWLAYLSSTGVYGDHQGAWVNENSSPHHPSQTGKNRLHAETAWLNLARTHQLPLNIFRLAGIYGPERNPLQRIIAGKPFSIYKKGHYFSRIHVMDIVSILLASIAQLSAFKVYNLADDEPAPSHVVEEYASTLLQLPILPRKNYDEANLSQMQKDFYSNNRRVCNAQVKKDLHLELIYPTYREGLQELCKNLI